MCQRQCAGDVSDINGDENNDDDDNEDQPALPSYWSLNLVNSLSTNLKALSG